MSQDTAEPVDEGGPEEPQPLCAWRIPTLTEGQTVEVQAVPGRITAVVGPNGSGKSALGYWLSQNATGTSVRRVIAHGRLWFEYAGPDITLAQRQSLEPNITAWGAQVDSRWRDYAQAQRAGFVLFDLLARINDYNAQVVELVKEGVDPDKVWKQVGTSILDRINAILHDAHLGITLTTTDGASFDAVPTR